MAKQLLENKNVAYQDTDLSFDQAKRQALTQETGQRTVPYIFIGDHFVGGYDDLQHLESTQTLDALLTT